MTEIFDPMAQIRRWPCWARWGFDATIFYAAHEQLTHVPRPGEPQQAILVTLLLFVVCLVLSEYLRPKPKIEDARLAALGDFNFPTATEARVIPLVWGRVKVEGPNIIWYGDLAQHPLRQSIQTGMWSKKRFIYAYQYTVGIQIGICRGPNTTLKRIWVGDREIWSGTKSSDGDTIDLNEPGFFGGNKDGNGGIRSTVEFYTGSSSQGVSSYLAQHQDAGAGTHRTPRYTGTSYLVLRDLGNINGGAYIGNSTQIQPWMFEIERYPSTWSGQTASNKVGVECNPMNVIYEILTNTEWGFGFPAADIDAGGAGTSFDDAANTLITEGNGFSLSLTRMTTSAELIKELERQMDGVVFLDHRTGKWTVKLIRDDYSIGSIPQINGSNIKEVRDYTRGSFEDTTNQITVKYHKRETDTNGIVYYKESFALAQDTANALIQGGGTVATAHLSSGEVHFPGCMNAALANQLAWRELRGQAYPLARATFVINREFWELTIGDVVAWTSAEFNYTQLPMRITRIDYGTLQANEITITCAQDVFKFATGSYGDPDDSLWNTPTKALNSYAANEQVVMEAPRAVVIRDPDYAGDPHVSKILASARQQTSELGFYITQRNASGTPGGTYADAGEVYGLQFIGQLQSALEAGVANPTSTITLVANPDSKTTLLEAFGTVTESDMGTGLYHLLLVGNEFMLVTSASDGGTTVTLNNVYRGVLDSAQDNHAANDRVYLLFAASSISDTNIPTTYNVDVQLDAFNSTARYTDTGTPTTVAITMAKRTQRPYPPAAVQYNGTSTDFGTPDMEGDGGPGENDFGCDVDWFRRLFTTVDEIASMKADDAGVDASHETRLRVFVDPSGANTEIGSSPFAWQTGTGTPRVPRNELIDIAAAGTEIRVQLETRHHSPLDAVSLASRYNFIHDVIPTSVNDSLFYLGGNINTGPSNSYAVVTAGVHVVDVASVPSAGNVEYRINGGSWLTVTPGGTPTASLSISDTIEVRQSSSGATPDPNFVWIDNPSATRVAYGCI